MLIRARAEAKSNEIIRLSTAGTVLQYRALERWDGKLPVMQGGDKTPLLTFDVGKLAMSDTEREKKLNQLLKEEETKGKATPRQAAQNAPVEATAEVVAAPAPAPANSAVKP